MKHADIVIVGAGIIGSTLAWSLRHSGLDVLVIDRAEPGSVTTTWSFAWLNASSKVRLQYVPEYVKLSIDGAHDPYQLGLDLSGDWLHATGNLELVAADQAATLERDVRRLVGLGYTAQLFDHNQLVDRHPELEVDDGTVAAWYPCEGWIDGAALVATIVGRLDGSKVQFCNDEVVGFDQDEHTGVTGVRLASGEQVPTDRVVLSAGAWTADLGALAGVDVPMIPRDDAAVHGLIVRATAPKGGLRHQVMGEGFFVRPHRSGEVLLSGEAHGIELNADSPADVVAVAAEELLATVGKNVPSLRGSRVVDAGVGLRALTGDRISIVGPSDKVRNVYVAVTHSGVSLAPILGKLIGRELLTGQPERELDAFRLTRFN